MVARYSAVSRPAPSTSRTVGAGAGAPGITCGGQSVNEPELVWTSVRGSGINAGAAAKLEAANRTHRKAAAGDVIRSNKRDIRYSKPRIVSHPPLSRQVTGRDTNVL